MERDCMLSLPSQLRVSNVPRVLPPLTRLIAAAIPSQLRCHSSSKSMSTPAAPSEPLFQLRSSSAATLPRLGSVLGRLPTPAVLTYTQNGLPPHLTIDNWHHLPDMTAFHIPLAALISQPSASALSSSHYRSPASLASYLHYPLSSFLLLSLSDPLLPVQQCNDASVVVVSPQGNQRVTPLQLIQRASLLRPDALLLASDCHVAASEAERGRERKAVWRSLRWMKEQLKALYGGRDTTAQTTEVDDASDDSVERKSKRQRKMEKQQEAARVRKQHSTPTTVSDNVKNEASAPLSAAVHVKPPYIIAAVPLTSDAALQQHFIQDIQAHAHLLDGYSVSMTDANFDAALALLPSVLGQLPSASLRVCSSHPHSLSSLFAIACSSVDLISTALPYHHSLLGLALSLHEPALSLHSTSLATSSLPLAADCQCYTCQHHTRAYVHHLLRVKEMTATVLLDMHNTHTVLQVVRMVRERVAAQQGVDGWQEWRDQWMRKFTANERVESEERDRAQNKKTADAPIATSDDVFVANEISGSGETPVRDVN